MLPSAPLTFGVGQSLRIEHQAQFHPLEYVCQLAAKIASENCRIFENSRVTEIDDDRLVVKTAHGEVHAAKIIMATHTPKGFNVLQTELGPYREYGLSARLHDNQYPDGIFWSLEEPSHSLRSYELNGEKHLIVIGEEHKTGQQEPGVEYYGKVEDYIRSRFNVESIQYRWSAQNYQPADYLPYIGKSPGSEALYVATGFGTNGLLYGPLAAAIIAEDFLGREHQWAGLYSSRRFNPAKAGGTFIKENINVAKQYVKDYLTHEPSENLQSVRNGEGALVKHNKEKLAAYIDEAGQLTALSPVCTHLGCIVHWNRLDKSWDCPCHGTRFQTDGEVIEGPAFTPLERKPVDNPVK